jgi:hypothetical protein
MAVLVTEGKGFSWRCSNGPWPLSLALGFGIFGVDLRDVSVRDAILESGEYGSQLTHSRIELVGGVACFAGQRRVTVASLPTCFCPPRYRDQEPASSQCPLWGICTQEQEEEPSRDLGAHPQMTVGALNDSV